MESDSSVALSVVRSADLSRVAIVCGGSVRSSDTTDRPTDCLSALGIRLGIQNGLGVDDNVRCPACLPARSVRRAGFLKRQPDTKTGLSKNCHPTNGVP